MKKLIICALFFSASLFLFTSAARADIIPPNSKPLNRCVKFVNLDKFPDVILIGRYTGPMVTEPVIYQVENNKCLEKGYKFNTLDLYWNTKAKGAMVNPDNLLLKNVETYGGYVPLKSSLSREDIEYSIAGFSGGKLIIYQSGKISEYGSGSPEQIETFANPLAKPVNTPTSSPTPSLIIVPTSSPASSSNFQAASSSSNNQAAAPAAPAQARRGFWQSIVCFFKGLFGHKCD